MTKREEMNEVGNRSSKMAANARERGDFEDAEQWMLNAEYYWNLAAQMPREE